jgi:hypothetical protein
LNVQSDFVVFAGDKHTRAICRANRGSASDIRKICVWDRIYHTPDKI